MNTKQTWQDRLHEQDPSLQVHLIGIGGAGLSAIATVLLQMGVRVSGSDSNENAATRRLAASGAKIFPHQTATNLLDLPVAEQPDIVLLSSAIPAQNPELRAAEQLDIPIVKRAEFLSILLANRRVIAIAGSHGKTTTTSMVVAILRNAGLKPGYIVGADVQGLGSAAAGQSDLFVIEADEYDRMFLGLHPTVAVITNVEWDHPDCYPTPTSFRKAFADFSATVAPHGLIISCQDDQGAEQLRTQIANGGPRWITYGLEPDADIQAFDLQPIEGSGFRAQIDWWNAPAGTLRLQVPGIHNIRNALAALAVACWCNVPSSGALNALYGFRGAARRFEYKGEQAGVIVLDDYAHHPTEIVATLAAARCRYPLHRIWAVFQPHTFSRTQRMLYRMGDSFEHADEVIVTDIFAAREQDDGAISAAELVAASSHPHIQHIAQLSQAASYLTAHVKPNDIVITLGAGDGFKVGEILLKTLQDQPGAAKPDV